MSLVNWSWTTGVLFFPKLRKWLCFLFIACCIILRYWKRQSGSYSMKANYIEWVFNFYRSISVTRFTLKTKISSFSHLIQAKNGVWYESSQYRKNLRAYKKVQFFLLRMKWRFKPLKVSKNCVLMVWVSSLSRLVNLVMSSHLSNFLCLVLKGNMTIQETKMKLLLIAVVLLLFFFPCKKCSKKKSTSNPSLITILIAVSSNLFNLFKKKKNHQKYQPKVF